MILSARSIGPLVASDNYFSFEIDPLGQPTVTAGSDHCFCTCCPSVRPHFSNLAKQKLQKTMVATGETVGLAEWII